MYIKRKIGDLESNMQTLQGSHCNIFSYLLVTHSLGRRDLDLVHETNLTKKGYADQ